MTTVNVDTFALYAYIFSRYSRLSNIRENMYIVKITFIVTHIGKNIKNANINQREIANFRKYAKIYTRENIYVHSISRSAATHAERLPIEPQPTAHTVGYKMSFTERRGASYLRGLLPLNSAGVIQSPCDITLFDFHKKTWKVLTIIMMIYL